MYLPDIELHECTSFEEAAALMREYGPDARILAGGTDLLVDLKTGRVSYDHLISINRINVLRGVSETGDGLRIGALTTITQLSCSPIIAERFSPILDATRKMAAPQIRNVATVGGNIASAVPCADLPPILTVMNASVVLWSLAGRREVPLDSFFSGPRQTIALPEELLIAVLVPNPPKGFGAAYARFQLRDGNAIAVAAVAASLLLDGDGVVRDARIVLGAVAPIPKFIESAGALLIGKPADQQSFSKAAAIAVKEAEPISDIRGSAEYRRDIVNILTRRALISAAERATREIQ